MADMDIPSGMITSMKNQNLSNNQIIQSLQRQGYTSTQIFDALSQSQGGMPVPSPPTYSTPTPMRPMESSPAQPRYEGSDTEEMIEAIIDEKWNDLLSDINKVIAWKEATDARLAKMEQQMTDLKDSFDKLQQAVVGKVGEYDQHILEVGAEVKAMEKVFSKVLPVFTDNVAELSRVSEQIKRNAQATGMIPAVKKL
jgi:hypothetical protein